MVFALEMNYDALLPPEIHNYFKLIFFATIPLSSYRSLILFPSFTGCSHPFPRSNCFLWSCPFPHTLIKLGKICRTKRTLPTRRVKIDTLALLTLENSTYCLLGVKCFHMDCFQTWNIFEKPKKDITTWKSNKKGGGGGGVFDVIIVIDNCQARYAGRVGVEGGGGLQTRGTRLVIYNGFLLLH